MTHPSLLPLLATAALLLSGCTIAGDYHIDDHATKSRGYRTIAGSVHVGRDATIAGARTVAGDIHLEDGATTRSLSTVAGDIHVGRRAKIDGDVSTIAGTIEVGAETHVHGRISTVAGAIELHGCRVDGPVRITKGSIEAHASTALPGGIVVRKTRLADDEEIPRVDIGAGAEVASIAVDANTPLELRISRDARVGKITGATPTYYP